LRRYGRRRCGRGRCGGLRRRGLRCRCRRRGRRPGAASVFTGALPPVADPQGGRGETACRRFPRKGRGQPGAGSPAWGPAQPRRKRREKRAGAERTPEIARGVPERPPGRPRKAANPQGSSPPAAPRLRSGPRGASPAAEVRRARTPPAGVQTRRPGDADRALPAFGSGPGRRRSSGDDPPLPGAVRNF